MRSEVLPGWVEAEELGVVGAWWVERRWGGCGARRSTLQSTKVKLKSPPRMQSAWPCWCSQGYFYFYACFLSRREGPVLSNCLRGFTKPTMMGACSQIQSNPFTSDIMNEFLLPLNSFLFHVFLFASILPCSLNRRSSISLIAPWLKKGTCESIWLDCILHEEKKKKKQEGTKKKDRCWK